MRTDPPATEATSPASSTYADRDVRQRDLVPPQRLAEHICLVVGVGAIGRQVALHLAASGAPDLILVDDDRVDVPNLAPQMYRPADLGRAKVDATAAACRELHPAIRIVTVADRFRRSSGDESWLHVPHGRRLATFACVDSMQSRRIVWDVARTRAAFFTDGRVSGESVRVVASDEPFLDEHYPTTLCAEAEVHRGTCSARSVVYAATIAAALMLHRFAQHLRAAPVSRDVLVNLNSDEIASL